jgi:predicted dehydrogenase
MKEIVLIGSGNMAIAYCEVLKSLNVSFTVVGNSKGKAKEFTDKTGKECISGGIEKYLERIQRLPDYAIVAVQVEALFKVATLLINKKIINILVEKPGGINEKEIINLGNLSKNNSNIYIAYNRRFYKSVLYAKQEIKKDGGALSARFEFTEWSHIIKKLKKSDELKRNWFLANSTHVIDLAFSLIGKPKELSSYTSGNIEWHKPSIYSGAGITDANCIFSYYANWESSGRWGVEVNTAKRKLILSPLEILQEQQIGSIEIQKVDLDYSIDEKFKPGVFEQVKAFIEDEKENLKPLEEQLNDLNFLSKINGKFQ